MSLRGATVAACLAAVALVVAARAEEPAGEPSCVVAYAVSAQGEITVTGARCDTSGLEAAALAFALARVEGGFRDMLLMQAPVEVEFTFSEAVIRRFENQRLSQQDQSQEGI